MKQREIVYFNTLMNIVILAAKRVLKVVSTSSFLKLGTSYSLKVITTCFSSRNANGPCVLNGRYLLEINYNGAGRDTACYVHSRDALAYTR